MPKIFTVETIMLTMAVLMLLVSPVYADRVIFGYTGGVLAEPVYEPGEEEVIELAQYKNWTLISVPVPLLSELSALQPPELRWKKLEGAVHGPSLRGIVQTILASPVMTAIDDQVEAKIQKRYSLQKQIEMLRIAPSPETAAWNDYVEECRSWGREEKAKLGL